MRRTDHKTVAFPRLNALSYGLYLVAGLVIVVSFVAEGGAAWLTGIFLVGVSSALNAINVIVTVVRRRAPGVAWGTLSLFVWSQIVTALLLLLAFPAVQAAAIFQLMDRVAGTSFFLASDAFAQPALQWQTHMTYAALALSVFQLAFVVGWGQTPIFTIRDSGAVPSSPNSENGGLSPAHHSSGARLGLWLFLASDAMFFGSLFAGYAMVRAGSTTWVDRFHDFPWLETLLLVGASAVFGAARFRLIVSHALALTFVVVKLANDLLMIRNGAGPAANLMLACWYALTWVHAAHVFGGAVFTGWLAGPSFRMADDERERWLARIEATRRYWLFVDLVWLLIVIGFYVSSDRGGVGAMAFTFDLLSALHPFVPTAN